MTQSGVEFPESCDIRTPRPVAAFFVCSDDGCGLRFPVTAADDFAGRCPRCGGEVRQVAAVELGPVGCGGGRAERSSLHLLLDNWRSLFNVGSIFRTADGAGIAHLHLCGITPTPVHRKLAKTALGAETTVAWSYHPDAVKCAEALRAQGLGLWVLEGGSRSESLWTCGGWDGRPLALAAGNEVAGVDPALIGMADRVLHIPMRGSKESLNVAVALSIACYWLVAGVTHGATKNDLTT